MWINENRFRYDRSRLRYPSDLTNAENDFGPTLRASNGDVFVVGLPYPSDTKRVDDPAGNLTAEANFRGLKAEPGQYATLARALDVIRAMRSDLYESSIMPILAAHQEASISLVPGGRVLDLLAHLNFAKNRDAPK